MKIMFNVSRNDGNFCSSSRAAPAAHTRELHILVHMHELHVSRGTETREFNGPLLPIQRARINKYFLFKGNVEKIIATGVVVSDVHPRREYDETGICEDGRFGVTARHRKYPRDLGILGTSRDELLITSGQELSRYLFPPRHT